jgi:ATP-dependent Clp protease adaptor protein ClpS
MAMELYFGIPASNPQLEGDIEVLIDEGHQYILVVWNDDVNTFDWVIETLVEVCGHSHEQAEQCALIIHSKGKYGVKEGDYQNLKPMCEAICERLINATIEETVS